MGSRNPRPRPRSHRLRLPRRIVWDANRKLTWDDFQGEVPKDAPEGIDAQSSVGVFSNWQTSFKCTNAGKSGKRKCTVTITAPSAEARFNPNTSWVRPNARTDDLLQHEQGHFDIAEVFARKKREQMSKFVGQSESAVADTDAEAKKAAEEKIAKKFMEVCEAITKEEDAMHHAYDTQTNHGKNKEQQEKWNEKIKKLLEKK